MIDSIRFGGGGGTFLAGVMLEDEVPFCIASLSTMSVGVVDASLPEGGGPTGGGGGVLLPKPVGAAFILARNGGGGGLNCGGVGESGESSGGVGFCDFGGGGGLKEGGVGDVISIFKVETTRFASCGSEVVVEFFLR